MRVAVSVGLGQRKKIVSVLAALVLYTQEPERAWVPGLMCLYDELCKLSARAINTSVLVVVFRLLLYRLC